jgi:hypothetical protein
LRFMSTGTPADRHAGRRESDTSDRRVREKPKAVQNHQPIRPYAQKL